MQYRGVEISLWESNEFRFSDEVTDSDFTVSRAQGLVFNASSQYGESYAISPEQALQGARDLIDNRFR